MTGWPVIVKPLVASVLFVAASSVGIGAAGILMFTPVQSVRNAFLAGALAGASAVLFVVAMRLAGMLREVDGP